MKGTSMIYDGPPPKYVTCGNPACAKLHKQALVTTVPFTAYYCSYACYADDPRNKS